MSKKETVVPSELTGAIEDIIKEYSDEVVAKLPEIVKAAAKKTVKTLKKESGSIGGTKYRGSFKSKKEATATSSTTKYVVYSTQYRLAHLLEHGHVIRNRPGGPVYGVTRAFPHWKPAEKAGIEQMEEDIRKAVEEG